MKWFLMAAFAAGAALLGCDTTNPDRVNPSGNYPDERTGNVETQGMLTVENVPVPPQIGGQGREVPAIDYYSIYDRDGRFLETARTQTVHLDPGRYLVRLNEQDQEPRQFWVTIESGKRTTVDANTVGPAADHGHPAR